MMGWLGDTKAGGETAFLATGNEALVRPTRGALAFWFNLYTDGWRDKATEHGGCPVILGSKWIVNKWTYSFNQWNNYPCRLEREKRIEPWAKSKFYII